LRATFRAYPRIDAKIKIESPPISNNLLTKPASLLLASRIERDWSKLCVSPSALASSASFLELVESQVVGVNGAGPLTSELKGC
jgi:hypothetical protein